MTEEKKFAVKRSPTGLGAFAQQAIPKNTRIIEYVGTLITNEEADKSKGRYIIQLNEVYALNGKHRTNLARYINHSCKPNAEAIISGTRIWIWSRKKIKPGDEITYDYGKEYFEGVIEPIGCKCEKCVVRGKGSAAKKSRRAKPKKSISLSDNSPRARGRAVADASGS